LSEIRCGIGSLWEPGGTEELNHEKDEIDEKAKASRSASPLSSISPFSWFFFSVMGCDELMIQGGIEWD
jgi:hypothetical protein